LRKALASTAALLALLVNHEFLRVLTVISAVFLPLNLIAGIFGMDFACLPLLKERARAPADRRLDGLPRCWLNLFSASRGAGCPAIFDACKALKMKESGNRVFRFPC